MDYRLNPPPRAQGNQSRTTTRGRRIGRRDPRRQTGSSRRLIDAIFGSDGLEAQSTNGARNANEKNDGGCWSPRSVVVAKTRVLKGKEREKKGAMESPGGRIGSTPQDPIRLAISNRAEAGLTIVFSKKTTDSSGSSWLVGLVGRWLAGW